jgi:hypothetical protein
MVKVGDKVRSLKNLFDITKNRVYTVYAISTHTTDGFAIRDDKNDTNWQLHREGEDYEIVTDDELTELRAWKESALARFPALAQRETDDEAAARLSREYLDSNENSEDFAKRVIAWARNNPA